MRRFVEFIALLLTTSQIVLAQENAEEIEVDGVEEVANEDMEENVEEEEVPTFVPDESKFFFTESCLKKTDSFG